MTTQVTNSMLAFDGGNFGYRNRIINGAMEISQRGTWANALASGTTQYGGPDRWFATVGSGTTTISLAQLPAGIANWNNLLRLQRALGQTNTGTMNVFQQIESMHVVPIQGKTVTLSCYARAGANYSSSGSTLTMVANFGTGVDQASIGGQNASWTGWNNTANSVTLTTSLQRFSWTFTIPASTTEMQVGFQYTPTGTAGTSDYFELVGVQLEVGSTATPFEYRPYGTELALCQRYYWQLVNEFCGYSLNGSSLQNGRVSFPALMRSAPTLSGTSSWTVNIGSAGVVAIANSTNYSVQFYNSSGNWNTSPVVYAIVNAGLTSEL